MNQESKLNITAINNSIKKLIMYTDEEEKLLNKIHSCFEENSQIYDSSNTKKLSSMNRNTKLTFNKMITNRTRYIDTIKKNITLYIETAEKNVKLFNNLSTYG